MCKQGLQLLGGAAFHTGRDEGGASSGCWSLSSPHASSLVPPAIEGAGRGPHVVKAVAGRPLALECVARGRPPPTLSWHHKGLPVTESNGTWLAAGGSVLSLESLGEASGGLYSCVASSPAGEAMLQYSVEVQGKPGPVPPGSLGLGTPPFPPTVCGGDGKWGRGDRCSELQKTDKETDEDIVT